MQKLYAPVTALDGSCAIVCPKLGYTEGYVRCG